MVHLIADLVLTLFSVLELRVVRGGVVARSVECSTPGEEVPGSISAVAARSQLVGSVSV